MYCAILHTIHTRLEFPVSPGSGSTKHPSLPSFSFSLFLYHHLFLLRIGHFISADDPPGARNRLTAVKKTGRPRQCAAAGKQRGRNPNFARPTPAYISKSPFYIRPTTSDKYLPRRPSFVFSSSAFCIAFESRSRIACTKHWIFPENRYFSAPAIFVRILTPTAF